MKFFRAVIPSVILVVALLCWIGLSDADSANLWPNKQGELCWSLDSPTSQPYPYPVVKLAVVRTFKDHYLVHGTITEWINNAEYVRCVNGNAEIVGNEVIMHGSTSGIYEIDDNGSTATEMIGGVGLVTLNLNTLDGISEGINMWYDITTGLPGDAGSVKYDGAVAWTLIPCD